MTVHAFWEEDLTITILTDNYPAETTWTLTGSDRVLFWLLEAYEVTGTEYVEQACVEAGVTHSPSTTLSAMAFAVHTALGLTQ